MDSPFVNSSSDASAPIIAQLASIHTLLQVMQRDNRETRDQLPTKADRRELEETKSDLKRLEDAQTANLNLTHRIGTVEKTQEEIKQDLSALRRVQSKQAATLAKIIGGLSVGIEIAKLAIEHFVK